MINLLPSKQKEELGEEEKLKLILILGILIISFLLYFSLILFLIKISIAAELEVQRIYFGEREKELEIAESKEPEEKIEKLNLNLKKLNSFYQNQLNLTEILEKTSQTLPAGIYLTNFNFNLKQGKGEIFLSGFSPNRETLLLLKKNLEEEPGFSEIYFPPENWLKPTDINFTLTFELK